MEEREPKLEETIGYIGKVTADPKMTLRLIEAVEKRDEKVIKEILVERCGIPRLYCWIVCYFICWVERIIHCGPVCRWVCRIAY